MQQHESSLLTMIDNKKKTKTTAYVLISPVTRQIKSNTPTKQELHTYIFNAVLIYFTLNCYKSCLNVRPLRL